MVRITTELYVWNYFSSSFLFQEFYDEIKRKLNCTFPEFFKVALIEMGFDDFCAFSGLKGQNMEDFETALAEMIKNIATGKFRKDNKGLK